MLLQVEVDFFRATPDLRHGMPFLIRGQTTVIFITSLLVRWYSSFKLDLFWFHGNLVDNQMSLEPGTSTGSYSCSFINSVGKPNNSSSHKTGKQYVEVFSVVHPFWFFFFQHLLLPQRNKLYHSEPFCCRLKHSALYWNFMLLKYYAIIRKYRLCLKKVKSVFCSDISNYEVYCVCF